MSRLKCYVTFISMLLMHVILYVLNLIFNNSKPTVCWLKAKNLAGNAGCCNCLDYILGDHRLQVNALTQPKVNPFLSKSLSRSLGKQKHKCEYKKDSELNGRQDEPLWKRGHIFCFICVFL